MPERHLSRKDLIMTSRNAPKMTLSLHVIGISAMIFSVTFPACILWTFAVMNSHSLIQGAGFSISWEDVVLSAKIAIAVTMFIMVVSVAKVFQMERVAA